MNRTDRPCLPAFTETPLSYPNRMFSHSTPKKHPSLDNQPVKEPGTCDSSVWNRLYRMVRQPQSVQPPENSLDFRLRTCYDHARETFASKARILVQPATLCSEKNVEHSLPTPTCQLRIIDGHRREHLSEACKGQHIGSDHFANGKHGYSRVIAGAISVD